MADTQLQDLPGQLERIGRRPARGGTKARRPIEQVQAENDALGIGSIEDRPDRLGAASGLEADHDRRLLQTEERFQVVRGPQPGVDPQAELEFLEPAIKLDGRVSFPRWHRDPRGRAPGSRARRGRLGPGRQARKTGARCSAAVDNETEFLRRRGPPGRPARRGPESRESRSPR